MTADFHEKLQGDLPAFAAGRLDEADRRIVEAHVEACEECASVLVATRAIAATLRSHRDAIGSPHPPVGALRRFALAARSTGTGDVARHVEVCASCSLQVAAWRRGTAMATRDARPWRSTLVAAASLAAGLILGAIAAPLLRPDGPAAITAAKHLPDLRIADGLRGAEDQPIVSLSSDRPVTLEIVWDSLEPAQSVGPLEFAIAPPGGSAVWFARLDRERVAEIVGGSRVFTFVVPSRVLRAGEYELTVLPAQPSGAPPWIHQRFRAN